VSNHLFGSFLLCRKFLGQVFGVTSVRYK